jgi:hypothetical protein
VNWFLREEMDPSLLGVVPRQIAVSEGGLRGFVAKEDIEAGELLVSVPWSATLRAEGRAPSQHIVSREYWAKAPWDVKLAARVRRTDTKAQPQAKFLSPILPLSAYMRIFTYIYI